MMTTVQSSSFGVHKSHYVLRNFAPIGMIQDNKISMYIINKLKRAGFLTISSLALVTKETLIAEISDLDEQLIYRIQTKVAEIIGLDFATSQATFQTKPTHIKTGSLALDNLLGGGLALGRVYQVFGESEITKRQFCISTALTCQLPYIFGGGFAKSIYIGPLLPICKQCISAVTQKYGMNIDAATDNILLLSPNSPDELTKSILVAKYMMSRDRYAVLIVDAVIAYYNGPLALADTNTQDIMPKFFNFLKLLAKEHSCVIIITDRMIRLPTTSSAAFDLNDIRLLFKDSTDANHIECQIIGSNGIEGKPTAFSINDAIISDVQRND